MASANKEGNYINKCFYAKTMKIKDLMTREVFTCAAEDPVISVVKKMIDQDIGMLVVVEDNLSKKPIGILSDRDILNRIVLKKADAAKITAEQIATKKIISIVETASINEATTLMKKNKVKKLVVLDSMDNLVGIISQSDVVKQFISISEQLADLSASL